MLKAAAQGVPFLVWVPGSGWQGEKRPVMLCGARQWKNCRGCWNWGQSGFSCEFKSMVTSPSEIIPGVFSTEA